MTVELAHPSTEPLGSRSPAEPAHPRWWFVATTPGRILTIGIVLAAPRRCQRLRHLDDHQPPAASADHGAQPHRAAVVRRRTALHHAVGRRRRGGHRVHRPSRAAHGSAALRAGHHRRHRGRDPGVERADRRTVGAVARPDQRRTGRLYRVDRDRADQQPGRQPGRLVVPVGGIGADAIDDPARRATALSGDVRAGGLGNHRIHSFPGSGDPGRRHHGGLRRVLASLAGPAHQAPDQSRAGRGRARYSRHGGVGRNCADHFHDRQS